MNDGWTDEKRKKMSEVIRAKWQDPEFRRVKIEGMNRPDVRAENSRVRRALWQDPEYAERVAVKITAAKRTPEARARQSERAKVLWTKPGHRERFSSSCRASSKYPTDESILNRLRELHGQGIVMCYKHIMKADCALWGAINRYFPSLKDAVEGAGLEYIKVSHGHTVDGKGCKPYTEIKTPEYCPDYAYFIGVLIGDGSIFTRLTGIKCDGFDKEMVDNFARIGQELFGIEPKWLFKDKRGPHRGDHGDTFYRVSFYSCRLAELMKAEIGKPVKRIPDWIKSGSPEVKSSFVRGFADAEGCARKDPRKNRWTVGLSQKNRKILEEIQKILEYFGIRGGIHKASRGCSCLVVGSSVDCIKFRDKIGFGIKRKMDKLSNIIVTPHSIAQLRRYRGDNFVLV
jgi:hypothetical protein